MTMDYNPKDIFDYYVDFVQRTILFYDILRKRANNMIEQERLGQPPTLNFKYQKIMDARKFFPPSNYALVKVTEVDSKPAKEWIDPAKRPIIIFDPRSGHGPGVGGLNRYSEACIALAEGYPVYFAIFYPNPIPHQTLSDVLSGLRQFVWKVKTIHQQAPILYGNSQAGWMVALLAAHCQDLADSVVMNGSPLSYWATGKQGNPMQILGGIVGGVWLTRLLSDINQGEFDGAWLVENFESFNLYNSYWKKYYDLFENPDEGEEEFLNFERWWTGYYSFSEEEITSLIKDLFIGNKAENGELHLSDGTVLDLKNIRNPILIFASAGDKITPPREALNWIRMLYPDTQALKEAGHRIAYLINPQVTHHEIFDSTKVVFEHRAILEHIDELKSFSPGLYEMIIEQSSDPNNLHSQVHFEERNITDLCGAEPTDAFKMVDHLSEFNDHIYTKFIQQYIQIYFDIFPKDLMKNMHPMRIKNKMFSETINPFMEGVAYLAKVTHELRHEELSENPLKKNEEYMNEFMKFYLTNLQNMRDNSFEQIFKKLYYP